MRRAPANAAQHETRSVAFADIFAGLGGFHVAMSKLGGTCVFAAEWDSSLQDLYEGNFGLRPHGDITAIEPGDVPDHAVLCAGFPCQPFSKAGDQQGFEHTEQGRLFFNVRDILRSRKPSRFILENVPNILNHDGGRTFARICGELRAIGYEVDARRYSPHQFGVPQIRDRVYLIGSLTGLAGYEWPTPDASPTSVSTVLGHGSGKKLSAQTLEILGAWEDFLISIPHDVAVPSFPIWAMEFGATYPYEGDAPMERIRRCGSRGLSKYRGSFGRPLKGATIEEQLAMLPSHARRPGKQFPHWKQAYIRQNREFYAANRSWINPWLPSVRDFHSSFQKFEWNMQGEERTLWKSVIQMRASGVRVKRPTTAPSLIAMTDSQVPIIAWERRYMTPEECAHLQSMQSINLPGSSTKAFRALGNAVNSHVVEQILRPLLALPGLETDSSLLSHHQPLAS